MSEWQPIETAPRDGTWILACNNRGNRCVILWSTMALRRKQWPVNKYDSIAGRERVHHGEINEQFASCEGWVQPYTYGEISPFWDVDRVKWWMPLPPPPTP